MLIIFCITILIISIIQLLLLHIANHSDGLKKIVIEEIAHYLMAGPVAITFMSTLVHALDGDVLRLGFTLIVFMWSSYYLSFGSRNRLVIPILNLIVSMLTLIAIYIFTHPPIY